MDEQIALPISLRTSDQFRNDKPLDIAHKPVTKLGQIRDEITGKVGRPRKYMDAAEKERCYRQRKKQRQIFPPLPTGPYRVLYADPPWKYSNDGLKSYGHAAFHYAAVSLEQLCLLQVKRIAAKNAVLFLWVTSPMLREAMDVVKAWGFVYKSCLIWDKMAHNYGHYAFVCEEFLFICTRGSCRPDIDILPTSIQRVPRTRKHSEKPEHFRRLIDGMYPEGQRLELFARTQAPGWDVWGNQIPSAEENTDGFAASDAPGDIETRQTH